MECTKTENEVYVPLEMEIIRFDSEDIITTSGGNGGGNGGGIDTPIDPFEE